MSEECWGTTTRGRHLPFHKPVSHLGEAGLAALGQDLVVPRGILWAGAMGGSLQFPAPLVESRPEPELQGFSHDQQEPPQAHRQTQPLQVFQ